MEGQSKRNNLVFHGIPEQKYETWDDYEATVRKILEEKMGMEEARSDTDIAIERAHRIGRFSKDRARLPAKSWYDYCCATEERSHHISCLLFFFLGAADLDLLRK